jgi:hypothetical protein
MAGGNVVMDKGKARRGVHGWRIVLGLLAASILAAPGAKAFYKQEGVLKTPDDRSREEQNRQYFTDLSVITQEGKERRF